MTWSAWLRKRRLTRRKRKRRERLNRKTLKSDAIVQTTTIYEIVEVAEMTTRQSNWVVKVIELIIDAQMAFFGTGCVINEQVILQDQEGAEKVAA